MTLFRTALTNLAGLSVTRVKWLGDILTQNVLYQLQTVQFSINYDNLPITQAHEAFYSYWLRPLLFSDHQSGSKC